MSTQYPTVAWCNGTNIYEVNLRQYTKEGSFKAFQKHLPRLKEMGVEILWLMPITPISQEKKKGSLGSYYACSSYVEINPEFGNKDDFRTLISEAHQLGFKLIIDWVANHTGWQHEWTKNEGWYIKNAKGEFTEIHGWDDVIDLNYENEEMQTAMIDAMKYWVGEFDIDGFRCDMAHLVRLDFWHKARTACETIKPLFWLGECDEDSYSEVFDTTYAWRWMHATEAFAKDNNKWGDIKNALSQYRNLPPKAQKLYFTSNHDENSWNGTEYEKYGLPLAKNLAVFSCMFPGIPLIYSGQELPNYKRLLFFDKDEIEWASQPKPQLQDFYRTLLTVRRMNRAFESDAQFTQIQNDDKVFAFFLQKENHKAVIIFNFSTSESLKLNYNNDALAGNYSQLFSGVTHLLKKEESFEVLPNDFLVYVTKP